MITNMIVLLCLSALFPVSMGYIKLLLKSDIPRDCSDVYVRGHRSSGVYSFNGENLRQLLAYCEMVTGEQGPWMVILRRTDSELNFLRPWESYKWGFGNKEREHWLGLQFIHQLTRRHQYNLRVDVEDFKGHKAYALYKSFSVNSEADGYKLHVSGFVNGGAGDSLSYHNGMKFSTYDKDQDNWSNNCAMKHFGGFWYNSCYNTNPTGHYLKNGKLIHTRATWYYWSHSYERLKSITMKISRVK